MESNSEANKAGLDAIKTQLAQLQDTNTALKLQVSTLQDTVQRQQETLDRMQADRVKERQALIDEVSALVADKTPAHRAHHPDAGTIDNQVDPTTDTKTLPPADGDTTPHHKKAPPDSLAPPPDPTRAPVSKPDGADDAASTEVHHRTRVISMWSSP